MNETPANLGVCFFSDRLYYAISDPESKQYLFCIGSFDFNFDVANTIASQHPEKFPHIKNTFEKLQADHLIKSVRALTHPINECWTALPKVAYDNADEREDHLSIIMKGIDRKDIEPTWHSVSKTQHKFLNIRRRTVMQGFDRLTHKVGNVEFLSDFEIARKWSSFNNPGGSFLMIGCHKNLISVTSFVLGKFRAATYIAFDQPEDLPYHWLQHAAHSSWLKGINEHIFLFGHQTHEIQQALKTFWDKASKIVAINSLNKIKVVANEQSYGFDLAAAFPAILLSLDV